MKTTMLYPSLKPNIIFRRLQTEKGRQTEIFIPESLDRAQLNEAAEQALLLCTGQKSFEGIAGELEVSFNKTNKKDILERIIIILTPLEQRGFMEFRTEPADAPRPMPAPVHIKRSLDNFFFESTNACNLKCVHCYAKAVAVEGDVLALDQVVRMVDQIAAMGCVSLLISGGEPLLRKDMLDIIGYAAAKPLVVRLLSNGILIDRTMAETLKEKGLTSVQISLDGHTAPMHDQYRGLTGAFDRTTAAIRHCSETGLKVDVSTVVHRGNIDNVTAIIELVQKYGITPVLARQRPEGRALCEGHEYQLGLHEYTLASIKANQFLAQQGNGLLSVRKQRAQRHRCSAGVSSAYVRSNGDVVPCGDFRQPGDVLGNITTSSIHGMWNADHPVLNRLRQSDLSSVKMCNSCPHAGYCTAGCPVEAYKTWGDYDWPDINQCAYYTLAQPHLKVLEEAEASHPLVIGCSS